MGRGARKAAFPRNATLQRNLRFNLLPSVAHRNSFRVSIFSFLVVLPRGSHPFPSRTRKLSLAGPMILRWKRRGNVGHRQDKFHEAVPAMPGRPFFVCIREHASRFHISTPTYSLTELLLCRSTVANCGMFEFARRKCKRRGYTASS